VYHEHAIRRPGAHPHSRIAQSRTVPRLMLNRQSLAVLVHPLTDNSYDDHSRYAVWHGFPVPLKLNTTSRTYRAEQYPTPR
jgi:aromatic ring-cleaving dioxygenase